MRPAFLTGSRVYGEPGPTSDWDVVLCMTEAEALRLAEAFDADTKYDADVAGYSVKVGKVNLLIFTDVDVYHAWGNATDHLRSIKDTLSMPIPRKKACEYIKARQAAVTTRKAKGLKK